MRTKRVLAALAALAQTSAPALGIVIDDQCAAVSPTLAEDQQAVEAALNAGASWSSGRPHPID